MGDQFDPPLRNGRTSPTATRRCRTLLARLIADVAPADGPTLAEALILRFGSLAATLAATPREIKLVVPDHPAVRRRLRDLRSADLHIRRQGILDKPILGHWEKLLDYLHTRHAFCLVEEVRVLFLDTKNRLISDEVVSTGTVDAAPLYPREVLRRALELSSYALIVVHNHPSGDPKPSLSDGHVTRHLVRCAEVLGIKVHDHIILTPEGYRSLRNLCVV